LNEAKRLLALQTALFEIAKSGAVVVIDQLKLADKKTAKAASLLKAASGGANRCLLVLEKKDAAQQQALRNLNWLDVADTSELNAWQLLKAKRVVFTKAAMDALATRFPKG
jgi:large subunit ribosomal protein L4